MKKSVLKILALALVAVMAVSALAACGGSSSGGSSAGTEDTGSAAAPADETAAAAPLTINEGQLIMARRSSASTPRSPRLSRTVWAWSSSSRISSSTPSSPASRPESTTSAWRA